MQCKSVTSEKVSGLRNASVCIATVTQESFESQYYITWTPFGTRTPFGMTAPMKKTLTLTRDSSVDLITSTRADSTAMERSNVPLSCNYSSATILQCQPYLMLSDPQR